MKDYKTKEFKEFKEFEVTLPMYVIAQTVFAAIFVIALLGN
jgi:hypothetical protein